MLGMQAMVCSAVLHTWALEVNDLLRVGLADCSQFTNFCIRPLSVGDRSPSSQQAGRAETSCLLG